MTRRISARAAQVIRRGINDARADAVNRCAVCLPRWSAALEDIARRRPAWQWAAYGRAYDRIAWRLARADILKTLERFGRSTEEAVSVFGA